MHKIFLGKSDVQFRRYDRGQTNTHAHTDTLITILRFAVGVEAITMWWQNVGLRGSYTVATKLLSAYFATKLNKYYVVTNNVFLSS